jgi:hypothetical protein
MSDVNVLMLYLVLRPFLHITFPPILTTAYHCVNHIAPRASSMNASTTNLIPQPPLHVPSIRPDDSRQEHGGAGEFCFLIATDCEFTRIRGFFSHARDFVIYDGQFTTNTCGNETISNRTAGAWLSSLVMKTLC